MSGTTLCALERTLLTWSMAAGTVGPEVTLASNVEVAGFSLLQVVARLHTTGMTLVGSKLELRLRPSGFTGEDPAQTFRSSLPEFARITFEYGTGYGTIAPVVALSDELVGFGTHVDLTVQLTQGAQSAPQSASISVDFSVKDERGPIDLAAIALLSSTSYFAGPGSAGPSWSATGGAVGIVFRKIIPGTLFRDYRVRRWTSATRGWRTYVANGANATLLTGQVDAQPVDISETNTVTLLQNKLHRAVLTNDNGTLECYLDGVLCSAGTALPSYTAPTTEALLIEGSASVADELEVVSVSVANTGMTAAQVAWWDGLVKAGGSRRVPNAAVHFEAADWPGGTSQWVDRVAAFGLTVTGTPVRRRIAAADVSWA